MLQFHYNVTKKDINIIFLSYCKEITKITIPDITHFHLIEYNIIVLKTYINTRGDYFE